MYQARGINGTGNKRRIRQIVVLLFTIIMGVLISQATQAQSDMIEFAPSGMAK